MQIREASTTIERLRNLASELAQEIECHRNTTMSKAGFRQKVRDLTLLWYEVKDQLGCPEEVSNLDKDLETLRSLANHTSLTKDYKEALWRIEEDLCRYQAKAKTSDLLSSITVPLALHERIEQVSGSLFRTGHYASAVLEAFKAVTNAVRAKSGRSDLDGQNLMATVFNENNPILRFNDMSDQSDKDEQTGLRFIFMGSVTGIRNPNAHDIGRLGDPVRALEMLVLASLLMKLTDDSSK